MPDTSDSKTLAILLVTTLISLVVAGIGKMIRRTHVIMMISGTGALVIVLAVLVMAFLVISRAV